MPVEEMEITTDLGHPGFEEDIDVDLDLAVGQPDELMDFGDDFDKVENMLSFNSDSRDEMMAERDDASYGMVDADDIDQDDIAVAAAADDIDIDLGNANDVSWEDGAALNDSHIHTMETSQIEPLDGTTSIDAMRTENEFHLQTSGEEAIDVDLSEETATGGNAPQDVTKVLSAQGTEWQDFGVSDNGGTAIDSSRNISGDVSVPPEHAEEAALVGLLDVPEPQTSEVNVSSETLQTAGHLESVVTPANSHEAADALDGQVSLDPGNPDDREDVIGYDNEAAEPESEQVDDSVALVEAPLPQKSAPIKEDVVEDDYAAEETRAQHDGSDSLPESTLRHGAELQKEPVEDQTHQGDTASEAEPHDPADTDTHQEPEVLEHGNEGTGEHATVEENSQVVPVVKPHRSEDAAVVATRHELYISYGETDYRLFAKSEDDDPNHYFLSDVSALDLPLVQFLASLRDVISGEISPLDELVLHVDGLGLEFSESTTSDFLTKYTFGDIVVLYDNLLRNDTAQPAAELDMYLMVRPNCKQRLLALLDSADAGRGLSEVAVYRGSTPDEEDYADELRSLQASISSGGEDVDHQEGPQASYGEADDGRHEIDVQPATAAAASADAPNSDNTSATATLNGDEQDEIDYSDDEEEPRDAGTGSLPMQSPQNSTHLEVPADDEITWESENEDARDDSKAPQQTVQVSPATGKRVREDSDEPEDASGENDVKRRRS
ncbi:hypothetical protein F4780DRAFT_244920 [Xylariomycetidae sp. FL0641]|nr:hypothetical protein F4780DRAFT_244920 [Xylariomycetidae sp. FL0641]